MNKVCLVGRISRDIELRKSSNGKPYVNLTLVVNDFYGGEKQAYFIPCIVWNAQAENASKYLSKGSLVSIEGSINYRSEKKDNGEYNNIFTVVVSRIEFLSTQSRTGENTSSNYVENTTNVQNTNSVEPSAPEPSDDDSILWDY